MLRIAGEQASGTILWMADERAIAEHVVPRITKAAAGAGDRRRGSSPASPSRSAPRTRWTPRATWANRVLGHAEFSPELPASARARRRHRRGRHPRGGRRVGRRRSPARLPRRGRHRPRGPHPLALGPDRAARIESRKRTAGVPRLALSGALTPSADAAVTGRSRRRPRGSWGSPGRSAPIPLDLVGRQGVVHAHRGAPSRGGPCRSRSFPLSHENGGLRPARRAARGWCRPAGTRWCACGGRAGSRSTPSRDLGRGHLAGHRPTISVYLPRRKIALRNC